VHYISTIRNPTYEVAMAVRKRKVNSTEWESKFLEKIKCCHKRNLSKVVTKIMKRTSTAKAGLVARSKKYDVECNITVDELRQLVYDAYGTNCKYCGRQITIKNLVFDHIIPISRNGSSNKENLQVICRTSNGMKGSLAEDHFNILLEWLNTVPEELSTDIRIRLSKGIH
jgi:5-methylcytosine-specific restriction endonuclease McrA